LILYEPCLTTPSRIQRWRKSLNGSRLTSLIEFYDVLIRHFDGVVAWGAIA